MLAARFREPVAVEPLPVGRGRQRKTRCRLLFDSLGELRGSAGTSPLHGRVHALRALPPDTADTLSVVAKDLAQDLRVLLLDEFFVGDIGDAMILGRLLEQLVVVRGVTLLTSSNIPPQELYRDGLQRASSPGIECCKELRVRRSTARRTTAEASDAGRNLRSRWAPSRRRWREFRGSSAAKPALRHASK